METLNKVFRTADIRLIDRYTIEQERIASAGLMERAATVFTNAFLRISGPVRRVVVVAGNGNNGGDGYAVARMLADKGIKVVVYPADPEGKMSPDCELNDKRWLEMGGEVKEMTDWKIVPGDVIIDAVFGSGLNRKVTGRAAEVIRQINRSVCPVVAVDMPSGLMGEDNGENDRETIVKADYTLTFQFPKLAFMLAENAEYVGDWQVLDIGLHPRALEETASPYYYVTEDDIRKRMPRPAKFAHKGLNGRGLLIAGKYGMMGAAVLAAKSAVRSGCGLLYVRVPRKGMELIQTTVPEAIPDPDRSGNCFSAPLASGAYDALAVGPAIGQAPETEKALGDLLKTWKGPLILDADALNILSRHEEWLGYLHPQCLLTPHQKEFERLAGKSKNDFDRLNKLSIFASRYRTYVILKGAYSVLATPDGKLIFNTTGNPGMAKGGAGDVLTGVLLGLAANGLDMGEVALIGMYAHGLAGDLVAGEKGYRGVCAGEIAEGIGKAWKRLEHFRKIKNI